MKAKIEFSQMVETPIIKAVIMAKIPENTANLKMANPTCFSLNGPPARISRTSVIGASFSEVAFSLKSSV